MLDVGADFDDELFEDVKQKNTTSCPASYNAKICEARWFEDLSLADSDDMRSIYKCRGDMAFYLGQYERALTCYDTCLHHVFSTNIPMWKDVQEARARCYIHMAEKDKATQITQQLVSMAANVDQHSTAWYLLATLHRAFKQWKDELHVIQCLLTLHPLNPDLWIRLAHIYGNIIEAERLSHDQRIVVPRWHPDHNHHPDGSQADPRMKTKSPPLSSDNERLDHGSCDLASRVVAHYQDLEQLRTAQYTCLIQARCLVRNVRNSVSSFAKVRNQQMQDRIDKELAKCNVSDETRQRCLQFLYGKQEDLIQNDGEKLEMAKNLTEASFEDQWFSWCTSESSQFSSTSSIQDQTEH